MSNTITIFAVTHNGMPVLARHYKRYAIQAMKSARLDHWQGLRAEYDNQWLDYISMNHWLVTAVPYK